MHAEMAAICTAARRGTAIGGATLYTTTYPCHECARLIIGVGVRRVVYIDPYPKSQVKMLFQRQVTEDPADASGTKVLLVPFEGVGPDLFPYVFQINQRGRDTRGTFEDWKPSPLAVWGPDLQPEIVNDGLALDVLRDTPLGQAWLQSDV
jgi:cytidine deaminase